MPVSNDSQTKIDEGAAMPARIRTLRALMSQRGSFQCRGWNR